MNLVNGVPAGPVNQSAAWEFLSENRWEILAILVAAAATSTIIALGMVAHVQPGALAIDNYNSIGMMAFGSGIFVSVIGALACIPKKRREIPQTHEDLQVNGRGHQGGELDGSGSAHESPQASEGRGGSGSAHESPQASEGGGGSRSAHESPQASEGGGGSRSAHESPQASEGHDGSGSAHESPQAGERSGGRGSAQGDIQEDDGIHGSSGSADESSQESEGPDETGSDQALHSGEGTDGSGSAHESPPEFELLGGEEVQTGLHEEQAQSGSEVQEEREPQEGEIPEVREVQEAEVQERVQELSNYEKVTAGLNETEKEQVVDDWIDDVANLKPGQFTAFLVKSDAFGPNKSTFVSNHGPDGFKWRFEIEIGKCMAAHREISNSLQEVGLKPELV